MDKAASGLLARSQPHRGPGIRRPPLTHASWRRKMQGHAPKRGRSVVFPPALNVGWAAEFMRLLLPGLFLGREVLE